MQHYVINFPVTCAGMWLSRGTPVSSPNKTDCHDISEILLEDALNIIPHYQTGIRRFFFCNSVFLLEIRVHNYISFPHILHIVGKDLWKRLDIHWTEDCR